MKEKKTTRITKNPPKEERKRMAGVMELTAEIFELCQHPDNKIAYVKEVRIETIATMIETFVLRQFLVRAKQENLQVRMEKAKDMGLTLDEFNYYIKHKAQYDAQQFYFKIDPAVIKRDYAKVTGQEFDKEKFDKERQFHVSEVEVSGKHVLIAGQQVEYNLVRDYVTHLSRRVHYDNAHTFESVRVELHRRLFAALGADRIEGRDTEIGHALESFLAGILCCICGGNEKHDGTCNMCGRKIKLEYYIANLDTLIIE